MLWSPGPPSQQHCSPYVSAFLLRFCPLLFSPCLYHCPSLPPEAERGSSPAERVLDPSLADVFFVPVFSSLSLVVNPLVLVRQDKLAEDAYDDDSMQVSGSCRLDGRVDGRGAGWQAGRQAGWVRCAYSLSPELSQN